MESEKDAFELIDSFDIIWKRKWLILLPTVFLIFLAIGINFLQPKLWEIDIIFQPSKLFVQMPDGRLEEVFVGDPKQIAALIRQASYNRRIAAEMKIDLNAFPQLTAENPRDTKLVRVSVKERNIERGVAILSALFNYLKLDLDRKIEVEIKGIDTKIASNKNEIKKKEIDIQSLKIEINKSEQEILSARNKIKISVERADKILDEMKSARARLEQIEKLQKNTLAQEKQESNALGLLLYSNEIQQNFRYYNTLEESLSKEKIVQEDLNFLIKERDQNIKAVKNVIEKTNHEISIIKDENELLNDKKQRIDYAQLIKEPTPSIRPVSPNKKLNLALAGFSGILFFTFLAFIIEYINHQKAERKSGKTHK